MFLAMLFAKDVGYYDSFQARPALSREKGRTCHALPDNYAISVEEVPKVAGGVVEGCGRSPPGIGASFLLERAIPTTEIVERPILLRLRDTRLSFIVNRGRELCKFHGIITFLPAETIVRNDR